MTDCVAISLSHSTTKKTGYVSRNSKSYRLKKQRSSDSICNYCLYPLLMYLNIIPENTRIDFVKQGRLCIAISTIIVLASVFFILHKGMNLGLDFVGGAEIKVQNTGNISQEKIRLSLKNFSPVIQKIGKDNNLLIKIKASDSKVLSEIKEILEDSFGDQLIYKKTNYTGPQVNKDAIMNGYISIGVALLGMILYLWIRFDLLFGLSGIIALVHDVITTMGFFAITGIEFNMTSVIALLTVIGYSINDSVVIYERIRDNATRARIKKMDKSLINRSINETLSRTILTSITTLMAALMLIIFGGSVLSGFSIAIFFGVAIGTYSSIFIAPQIIVLCKKIS